MNDDNNNNGDGHPYFMIMRDRHRNNRGTAV